MANTPSRSSPDRLPTQARQGEIVAAALRLAESASPAAITTTDLAHAVGLTQGALFKHFPNKEAVWVAALQWVSEHLMLTLTQAAHSTGSPGAALRAVFEAHVQFVTHHPGVPRLVFHVLQQAGQPELKAQARSLLKSFHELVQRLLESALANGEVAASVDRGAAATMFLGLLQGLVMQSLMSGQPEMMRLRAHPVYELYWRAVRAKP